MLGSGVIDSHLHQMKTVHRFNMQCGDEKWAILRDLKEGMQSIESE